jgi:Ser/Thr protein kinase RdoA (MazF antagonist)
MDSDLTKQITDALAAYDLGPTTQVVPLPGQHANAPHMVDCGRGRLLARLLAPGLAAPGLIETRHALAEHLAARGVRTARFLPRRDGTTTWVRLGERAIEMREWVKARPAHPGDAEDARKAGQLLAQLHLAGRDFEPPCTIHMRGDNEFRDAFRRLTRMEQQMQTYLPAPELIARIQANRAALEEADRALERGDLPTGMLHGGFVPRNVLLDDSGHPWTVDLDQFHPGALVVDLARAAMGFGASDALGEAYASVRALTREEGRAFTALTEAYRLW